MLIGISTPVFTSTWVTANMVLTASSRTPSREISLNLNPQKKSAVNYITKTIALKEINADFPMI